MKTLNILHISDAHIQKKDEDEIEEIVAKLTEDIIKVQKQEGIKVNLVCFTGDLIQRGDKAFNDENQWELAHAILVDPLLERLELTKNEFIIVPGNHEVDISKIVEATEKGLLVSSLEDINNNLKKMHNSYLDRLSYFYSYMKDSYEDIFIDEIGYAFIKEINGISVGLVCLDSAWRSSGDGEKERGRLYVGEQQVRNLYKYIKKTDVKICMMHHPIDWLSGYESNEIEKQLCKFNIVLCGHVHENDNKVILRRKMNTIYNIAGKLYPLDYANGKKADGYNGYSIINIDLEKSLCNIFMRTYYGKEREIFDVGIDYNENGKIVYPLNEDVEEMKMEYGIINGLEKFFRTMSETLLMINQIDSASPSDMSEIYVDPILANNSEYEKANTKKEHDIKFQEIINGDENVIIIGKKESGKTTILQKIGLTYVNEFAEKK